MLRLLIIPDTHRVVRHKKKAIKQIAKGYEKLIRKQSIDAVVHTGNLVGENGTKEKEWKRLQRLLRPFYDAKIPVILSTGTHEQSTKSKNTYRNFYKQFRKKTMENETYITSFFKKEIENSIYHVKGYQFITLEATPRQEVVQWMKKTIETSSRPTIIITSQYLRGDGTHHEDETLYPDRADGLTLWQTLKTLPQVKMVISGHFTEQTTQERAIYKEDGTALIQLFQNFEQEILGGSGKCRLVEYTENQTNVKTYIPFDRHWEKTVTLYHRSNA